MTHNILLFILVIHYLGDFILQSDKQAKNKYKGELDMFSHVSTYSFVWLLFTYFMFNDIEKSFQFAIMTFVAHFLTDLFTSNLTKYYADKKDYHNMFVVIGFDQILHYIQLYICIDFLFIT